MSNLQACRATAPIHDGLLAMDLSSMTEPIAEYEMFNFEIQRPRWFVYPEKPIVDVDISRFDNITSKISATISKVPTDQTRQLTLEEKFVERMGFTDDVIEAMRCIEQTFGEGIKSTLKYIRDPEELDLEWLDVVLHFDDVQDDAIADLLDKMDLLNEKFEAKSKVAKAYELNFVLDVQ